MKSTADNYNIDDLSSGDETDDDENPRKQIPQWATKPSLNFALKTQYKNKLQPETIFKVNIWFYFRRLYARYEFHVHFRESMLRRIVLSILLNSLGRCVRGTLGRLLVFSVAKPNVGPTWRNHVSWWTELLIWTWVASLLKNHGRLKTAKNNTLQTSLLHFNCK